MSAPAVAVEPPSRWLLVLTIIIVAGFTVLRFWFAATLDLRSDEAYYWTWSREWVLSYLDHPPMVAWFEKIGIALFGNTPFGVRFAQLVSLPLIELLLADIARRRTGSWNAALFVVIALEATIYYGLVIAIIEPTIPMLLFGSLFLWALCRLDETMDGRWLLLAGVAAGLAMLSKLFFVLLAPAIVIFMLSKRHRGWLRMPWPWAGLALAVIVFSPVIVWNVQHEWAGFAYQRGRLSNRVFTSVVELLKFLAYDTLSSGLLLVPLMIVVGFVTTIRAAFERRPYELMIAVAFTFPLLFFVLRSLGMQINQSWTYFMWPIGILALAIGFRWSRRWIAPLLVVVLLPGLGFNLWVFHHALIDTQTWRGKDDPFGMDAGFGAMSEAVLAEASARDAKWIATTEYRTYANLLWHIGDRIPIVQVNQRARFLDFAPVDPSRFTGRALYVYLQPSPVLDGAARAAPLEVPVVWRDQLMMRMHLETLDGFTPDLTPAPGSRAYVATP